MRITRAEKSVLSDWWFTVDRLMFFGLLLLMTVVEIVLLPWLLISVRRGQR